MEEVVEMFKKKVSGVTPTWAPEKYLSHYQNITVNLSFADLDQEVRCIGIISAVQNEGKTTTAINLAQAYALNDKKVILLDFDLRAPKISKVFNVVRENGLSDYLKEGKEIEQIIQHGENGVDFITAGSMVPYPNKVFDSTKIDELIISLKEKYDYIIIDTAPVLLFPDILQIARLVDGYLITVAYRKTNRRDLKKLNDIIATHKIRIVGATFVNYKTSKKDYYYKY